MHQSLKSSSYCFFPAKETQTCLVGGISFCISVYTHTCYWSATAHQRLWFETLVDSGHPDWAEHTGKDSPAPGGLCSYQARWPPTHEFLTFLFKRSAKCVPGWEHTGTAVLAVKGNPHLPSTRPAAPPEIALVAVCCSAPEVEPVLGAVLAAADGAFWRWVAPACFSSQCFLLGNSGYLWLLVWRVNFSLKRLFEITCFISTN